MNKEDKVFTEYAKKVKSLDEAMRPGVNFDTVRREFLYGGSVPAVFYCLNGLSNADLTEKLLEHMQKDAVGAQSLDCGKDLLGRSLPYAELSVLSDKKDALRMVYSGCSLLVLESFDGYILIDCRKFPQRSIEEPQKDKVLRGSRDGFSEALTSNSALIRRRIRDERLICEHLSVGSVTKTDLLICYVKGLSDEGYVKELKEKIGRVKTDGLNLGLETLTELIIQKKNLNPFPKVRYTERPDAAAAMLLEGSVIVLCDNYPAAMILPTSLFDFLQDTDDFYFSPVIGTYLKLVRNFVYALSLLLTPIWFSLQRYSDSLPEGFRFLIYEGKSFLPLIIQLLLVEIAIDGLKLASLNTPDTLSNSLSVISGLILGDLAIGVGWLSEQVILYMAFVSIANFTQPSYELGYAFKFMRILTLILIQLFSFAGLIAGVALTVVFLASNKTFFSGRGYLYPLVPFDRRAFLKLILRFSASKEKRSADR